MKKLFITLAMLLAINTGSIYAQTVTRKGNTITQVKKADNKEKKATEGKKTAYTYVIDGKSYPVYQGPKGGYYIIRKNSKGEDKKQYITKQLKEVGIK